MIGKNLKEFIETAYYGDEVEFKLNGTTYFMQGYNEDEKYTLTIDYWQKNDGTEPEHDYLLNVICNSQLERMHCFEKAKIFNGQTIYEVEQGIEVLYG